MSGWQGRSAILTRGIKLLRLLETRKRYTLRALARQLEVHPRTVRRDLAALAAAGVVIAHDCGDGTEEKPPAWWLGD